MYRKYLNNLLKSGLTAITLMLFSGCNLSGSSSSTPAAPVAPVYPPIPFPSAYIRSTSQISINLTNTVAENQFRDLNTLFSLFESTARALDSRITVTQKNGFDSNVVLDFSNFNIPAAIAGNKIDFGNIVISTISDTNLVSCGGSTCSTAFIRFYTTGNNGGGFWDNTDQASAPITINTIPVGSSTDTAAIVQEQPIGVNDVAINNTTLIGPPIYDVVADFTGLPVGSYQTNLIMEYGLEQQQVPSAPPPLITLTSLNGSQGGVSQVIAGNSQQIITWTASDPFFPASPIHLEYSIDGGSTWTNIVTEYANTGSYTWTAPAVDTNLGAIRVTAFDLYGNKSQVQSQNSFSIATTPPTVTTSGIVANQVVAGGSILPIHWVATDTHFGSKPITLFYSTNGATWLPITTAVTNSAVFNWSVPNNFDFPSVQVKITAMDEAGNTSSAITPQFVIDSTPPTLVLSSLNGGDLVKGGSSVNITWNANDANFSSTPIEIEYSVNNGTSWQTVVAATQNSGSFNWIVPMADTNQALIRITATDLANHAVSVVSANNFIIDSTFPVVALTSFTGAQTFIRANTVQPITWSATDSNFGATPIELDYSLDNGTTWSQIVPAVGNTGVYNWTVPSIQSGTSVIRVVATDAVGHISSSVSSSSFVITQGSPVTLSMVSGDNQTIPRDSTIQSPLVVNVVDQFGFPVPTGTSVSFFIDGGSGTLLASTVLTSVNGNAQVYYNSGATLGINKVRASALKIDGTTTSYDFTVNVQSYSPTSVSYSINTNPEYSSFSGTVVGISPSGSGLIPNFSAGSTSGSGFSAINFNLSASGIPVAVSSAQSSVLANLSSGTDSINVLLTDTFTSGTSAGSCAATNDSLAILTQISCSLTNSPNYTFLRNQIDNGTLKLQIVTAGEGPLDFLNTSQITLKRTSIKPVSNTNSLGSDAIPVQPVTLSGLIYFVGSNANGVNKLYSYDPVNLVIKQISNVSESATVSDTITTISTYSNSLYFVAEVSSGVNKLFQYNPVTANIVQISNTAGPGISDNVANLIVFRNVLYFGANNPSSLNKLYSYCDASAGCTNAGISLISNLNSGQSDNIGQMAVYNSLLYFSANSTSGFSKLFRYCDGGPCITQTSAQGIFQLSNLSTTNDNPGNFLNYDGSLYFSANISGTNSKLFNFNSSTSTLNEISNINASGSDSIGNLTLYGGNLYFSASSGTNINLYWYNDFASQIVLTSNTNPAGSDNVRSISNYNNSLFFSASNSGGFSKLYRYDGTSFYQISNMNNSANDDPKFLFSFGNYLYLRANSSNGVKLYEYCEPEAGCSP
jgi:hypothetical protein